RPAVPALMQLLRDKEESLRIDGAMALKAIGLTPKDVPGLLQAFSDYKREEGGEILRQLVPALKAEMIAPLTKSWPDTKPGGRLWTAAVLEELGPEVEEAVPELVKAAADKDSDVRRQVLEALWKTGAASKVLTPVLTRAIKDDDVLVRVRAAQFL